LEKESKLSKKKGGGGKGEVNLGRHRKITLKAKKDNSFIPSKELLGGGHGKRPLFGGMGFGLGEKREKKWKKESSSGNEFPQRG